MIRSLLASIFFRATRVFDWLAVRCAQLAVRFITPPALAAAPIATPLPIVLSPEAAAQSIAAAADIHAQLDAARDTIPAPAPWPDPPVPLTTVGPHDFIHTDQLMRGRHFA